MLEFVLAHGTERGEKGTGLIQIIVRRDADKADVYHVVGTITPSTVGFFDRKDKLTGSEFGPSDLLYRGK